MLQRLYFEILDDILIALVGNIYLQPINIVNKERVFRNQLLNSITTAKKKVIIIINHMILQIIFQTHKEIKILIRYHIIKKKTQISKNCTDNLIGFCVCGRNPHS